MQSACTGPAKWSYNPTKVLQEDASNDRQSIMVESAFVLYCVQSKVKFTQSMVKIMTMDTAITMG